MSAPYILVEIICKSFFLCNFFYDPIYDYYGGREGWILINFFWKSWKYNKPHFLLLYKQYLDKNLKNIYITKQVQPMRTCFMRGPIPFYYDYFFNVTCLFPTISSCYPESCVLSVVSAFLKLRDLECPLGWRDLEANASHGVIEKLLLYFFVL